MRRAVQGRGDTTTSIKRKDLVGSLARASPVSVGIEVESRRESREGDAALPREGDGGGNYEAVSSAPLHLGATRCPAYEVLYGGRTGERRRERWRGTRTSRPCHPPAPAV